MSIKGFENSRTEFVLIDYPAGGFPRFRVSGGTLAEEWAKTMRPGCDAWCEFTVNLRHGTVSCYGGEVWPMAWPAFFRVAEPHLASNAGCVWLTDAGLKACRAAVARGPWFILG